MSRTVHRYRVAIRDEPTRWEMRSGAEVVHVGFGPNTLPGHVDVWVEEDLTDVIARREFYIVGTGHPVPERAARHVGSVFDQARRLMWHVYEGRG